MYQQQIDCKSSSSDSISRTSRTDLYCNVIWLSSGHLVFVYSGVFRISERGAIRRGSGVRGRGLGISYRCNNRVQNPFSVPYNLLRVFEDDNTTNYSLN